MWFSMSSTRALEPSPEIVWRFPFPLPIRARERSEIKGEIELRTRSLVCRGPPEEFDLGEVAPGAMKVLKFSCALGSAIKSGSPIPISVIFTTEFDEFSKEEPLNLVMNAPGTRPQAMEPAKPIKAAPPPEKAVLSDEQRKVLAKNYYEKGNASFEARDYEDAASSYTKAIELEDSFAPLFYNLGMTQRALNQNKEAIRNFKRYLVLRPDAPNASEVLQTIEVLGE